MKSFVKRESKLLELIGNVNCLNCNHSFSFHRGEDQKKKENRKLELLEKKKFGELLSLSKVLEEDKFILYNSNKTIQIVEDDANFQVKEVQLSHQIKNNVHKLVCMETGKEDKFATFLVSDQTDQLILQKGSRTLNFAKEGENNNLRITSNLIFFPLETTNIINSKELFFVGFSDGSLACYCTHIFGENELEGELEKDSFFPIFPNSQEKQFFLPNQVYRINWRENSPITNISFHKEFGLFGNRNSQICFFKVSFTDKEGSRIPQTHLNFMHEERIEFGKVTCSDWSHSFGEGQEKSVLVFVGGEDDNVHIFQLKTISSSVSKIRQIVSHNSFISSLKLHHHKESLFLISASIDSLVKLWFYNKNENNLEFISEIQFPSNELPQHIEVTLKNQLLILSIKENNSFLQLFKLAAFIK